MAHPAGDGANPKRLMRVGHDRLLFHEINFRAARSARARHSTEVPRVTDLRCTVLDITMLI